MTLTWDDPNDDSITGYMILRRNRDTDAEGEFTTLVSDTGTADTTYTNDSVAAETPYTYRIKAINDQGVSERSRWFHIDTPEAPTPESDPASSGPRQPHRSYGGWTGFSELGRSHRGHRFSHGLRGAARAGRG